MRTKRTFVGLDVHARSVTGHALDADTGEIWQRKLTPDPADVLGWVSTLPGPVKVGYQAGPTGYGLFRFLNGSGPRGRAGGLDAVAASVVEDAAASGHRLLRRASVDRGP